MPRREVIRRLVGTRAPRSMGATPAEPSSRMTRGGRTQGRITRRLQQRFQVLVVALAVLGTLGPASRSTPFRVAPKRRQRAGASEWEASLSVWTMGVVVACRRLDSVPDSVARTGTSPASLATAACRPSDTRRRDVRLPTTWTVAEQRADDVEPIALPPASKRRRCALESFRGNDPQLVGGSSRGRCGPPSLPPAPPLRQPRNVLHRLSTAVVHASQGPEDVRPRPTKGSNDRGGTHEGGIVRLRSPKVCGRRDGCPAPHLLPVVCTCHRPRPSGRRRSPHRPRNAPASPSSE
jgi:hypothetical protein